MGVRPADYNIELAKGADYPLALRFGFDLTGWTVTAQVLERSNRANVYGAFSVAVTDAANGEVELLLLQAVIDTLPKESWWEVTLERPDGVRQHYIRGWAYSQ